MIGASYAAFSGNTSNGPDTFSVGSVTLSDDDTGSAMFTTGVAGTNQISAAGLMPGDIVQNCIKVSFAGSGPATVKLYADAAPGGTGLAAYLHVKVEEAATGSFGCASFAGGTVTYDTTHPSAQSDLLSAFPITYASGVATNGGSTWANGTSRSFRFTVTVDSGIPDAAQGETCSVTFDWQAQS
jgi:hypothetical protein